MATPSPDKMRPIMRQNSPSGQGFMPVARWVDVVSLGAATAVTYTVPTGVTCIRLTPTAAAGACFGNVNSTAVIPAAAASNGSGSFPVVSGMLLSFHIADALSLIATSAGFITAEGWS